MLKRYWSLFERLASYQFKETLSQLGRRWHSRRWKMTRRLSVVILSTIATLAAPALRGQEVIVPAGTILHCTLNEPNLSSKTAQPGDPVLCDAGPLYVFGVPALPRGAYLEGRFADFRNPGHFWGKGWMQLDFDRILLPGAEIPLSTKVTSVPHLKVDTEGKIHGRGHAGRDAVEWMIPVLWPVKIITLPMRGPRPTIKGETRISLKLMEDLPIPQGAGGFPADRQRIRPGAFRPGTGAGPDSGGVVSEASSDAPAFSPAAAEDGTAFVLRDGESFLVKDYWFEDGRRIHYYAYDGSEGVLPIQQLDLGKTAQLNRQHGVEFVIRDDGDAGN